MKKILIAVGLLMCLILIGCADKTNNLTGENEAINTTVAEKETDALENQMESTTEVTKGTAPAETEETKSETEPTETTEAENQIATEENDTTSATVGTEPATDPTESTEETFPETLPPEWAGIETERDES